MATTVLNQTATGRRTLLLLVAGGVLVLAALGHLGLGARRR